MELIEREVAKAKKVYCKERHEYVVPVAELDWLPTIAAAPVVHGKWINPDNLDCHCSVCGEQPEREPGESVPLYDYCPYCGARMDGGEEHG